MKLCFSEPPAVGFDLDLTLVDSRGSMRFALDALNAELSEHVDVEAYVAEIGPPVRDHLLTWIPPERVDRAVVRFRELVTTEKALEHNVAMPGAAEILRRIAELGGRSVVITSKLPRIAAATLTSTGLEASVIVGDVAGEAKAPAMREHRIDCYVGDHPLDMQGATTAGVSGIGVLTGNHSEYQLREAGAGFVVTTLGDLVPHLGRRA
jgi:phosphoglycolate phosphatase